MAGSIFVRPKAAPISSSGAPYAGAKYYFYATGTSTLQSVYTDSALTTPHANPVVADGTGTFAPIWLDPTKTYRAKLTTAAGVLLEDVDPVDSRATAAGNIVVTPEGETASLNLNDALALLNSATAQTQQVMQGLSFGRNVNIVVLSDSTADATTEWVYLLAVKLGVDFPTFTIKYQLWNTGTNNYGAATTIQTGSGAYTLTFYNASVAGATAMKFAGAYFSTAVRPAAMGQDPDLVMLSYGHNGSNQSERQIAMTGVISALVSRYLPFTPVILIGENPVTTDSSMTEKTRLFRSLAAEMNYGWIDVNAYFIQYAVPLANYYVDTVHPNAAGSALWADCVHQAFKFNRNAVSGAPVSTLNRGPAYVADSYAAFAGWSTTGLTVSRETSIFETNGESTKLTGSGTTSAFLYKNVITGNDIRAYVNRYVTATVRVWIPSTAGADVGTIALYDGTSTYTMPYAPKENDWTTVSITMKVAAAATALTAYIYLSTSGATTDICYVDRITISDGQLPADATAPTEFIDLDYLSVLGSNASGVMVMRNANTGTRGLQILDTAGSDQDNPDTQYTTSLNAIGLYGKAKADAYDRIQVNGQTGYIYFGLGTIAPSGYLRGGVSANEIRCGAAFYPDATGTRTLGASGIRWSVVYADALRIGSSPTTWQSGAGSPEAFITANVGSLYTRTDGGAGTTLYVKESGTGNTGWVAK